MKVLLLEDVYNLGRAGEIKKVANGYGRNYLIPQGLAVLATPGALAQAHHIQEEADLRRSILNKEMSVVADKLEGVRLEFPARAGETGKLYGSITTQMISDGLTERLGVEINKRQIDSQPLRLLGLHKVKVRLTIDLIPEFDVVVFREGESPENYLVDAEMLMTEEVEVSPEEVSTEIEEEVIIIESDESLSQVTDENADLEEAEEPAE